MLARQREDARQLGIEFRQPGRVELDVVAGSGRAGAPRRPASTEACDRLSRHGPRPRIDRRELAQLGFGME
jgi:hypothetical protein